MFTRCPWAAFAVVSFLLAVLFPSAPTQAQPASSEEMPLLDAFVRSAVVDSITAAIDSIYVLEEPAKRIVATLRDHLEAGDYDDLTDPVHFAQRLHDDAQAVRHDGHFRITALPPLDPDVVAAEQNEDPAEVERDRQRMRARNYGFRTAEILPGGVGYLRFDQFGHGDEAFAAATAAMNFLGNCNALILDLRHNGGGSAAMIRYLCGYLFEEQTHLINWDVRAEQRTEQSHSADYVPGRRLTTQPVYVLVSARTFSAAEEFSFDLQNHDRALLVGETTGGGGHTVAGYVFGFEGFRILIRLPYGRAYDPLTGEGWEGVGVKPDIEVSVADALDAAHEDALRKLLAAESDEVLAMGLRWALQDVETRRHPVMLSIEEMRDFVGHYGPRTITLDDGELRYQREDGPLYGLSPLGDDTFRVGDLDYFRLSFERDDTGRVVRIIGNYDNGRTDGHDRDGARRS